LAQPFCVEYSISGSIAQRQAAQAGPEISKGKIHQRKGDFQFPPSFRNLLQELDVIISKLAAEAAG
jgi:hypothetical protein